MKKGRGVLAACLSRTIEFTKQEPSAVAFGKNLSEEGLMQVFLGGVKSGTVIAEGVWGFRFFEAFAGVKPLVGVHFDCYLLRLLNKRSTFFLILSDRRNVSEALRAS